MFLSRKDNRGSKTWISRKLTHIPTFFTDGYSATSIEYALIASLVSVAILIGITALSGNLESLYNTLAAALAAAI